MIPNRSSRTAEGATMIRLLHQQLPESRRALQDPWVGTLALTGQRWLARIPFFARWCLKVLPRMVDYVPVRDRFADEVVDESVLNGARQVVILGAGLDTLAYRVLARHPDCVIYEVDLAETQETKRQRVRSLADRARDRVRYVTTDFERDDFRARLLDSGFQPDERSVFIWMGVLYYLSEDAVRQTLSRAHDIMTPGSQITFDFWPNSMVHPTMDARLEARRKTYARLGEPLKFGLDPDQLADFVAPVGFDVARIESVVDLARKYVQRDMDVPAGMSLASLVAQPHPVEEFVTITDAVVNV